MKTRYSLAYVTPEWRRIVLVNLLPGAADLIEQTQQQLGSFDFERAPQSHAWDYQLLGWWFENRSNPTLNEVRAFMTAQQP
jgi:hypothetical protein